MDKEKYKYILGIESSCDETAAAIVVDDRTILSNVIYSQITEHQSFGGVVPEIAARAHLEKIDVVTKKALEEAGVDLSRIDAVAATCGPGLIGGVIVGATFAKSMSMCLDIPFIAVNHIEAHAISVRLTENVEFPYLIMLASGGHCQLCVVHSINKFEIIGKTLDDSVGESFDKVAKMLGLGYPGGPAIERLSHEGNASRFALPRPLCSKKSSDFSFSGLKTAVKIIWEQACHSEQDKIDLAASFQKTVVDILSYKINASLWYCRSRGIGITAVVMAGGVAANRIIRKSLQETCDANKVSFFAPPPRLCTDNAVMIAWLGVEKFREHQYSDLDFAPRPRWPMQGTCP